MLKLRSIDQVVQKLSSGKENETFGCCDLNLDPMTFISELDLDMVVTYLRFKGYHSDTHTHTHRQTDRQTGLKPVPTRICRR